MSVRWHYSQAEHRFTQECRLDIALCRCSFEIAAISCWILVFSSSSITGCVWKTWVYNLSGNIRPGDYESQQVFKMRSELSWKNVPQNVLGNASCIGWGNLLPGTIYFICINITSQEPETSQTYLDNSQYFSVTVSCLFWKIWGLVTVEDVTLHNTVTLNEEVACA
jgi:hypothetical protein